MFFRAIYLNYTTVKSGKKSALNKQFIVDDDADFVHAVEKLVLSSYLLGMIHADEERSGKNINAADDEIPPIKFKEAVEFLKRKVPITKAEWKSVEPKARFRAFTVAKLGSATLIDTVKQQLLGVLEDGKGYAEFWNRIKQTVENDVSKIKPGYWETVFRTNTQSAYVAGKLQQFENSGVAAYQLMVIEDVRTSQICRNLLNKNSGYGIILPVEHPFWQKYGFPPYHFNCRSSIRGVWPSQVGKIGNVVENPTMKSLKVFKPQGDFGGNPLAKGSWWELTAGQMEQAKEFGVLHILQLSQANIKTGARSSVVNKILNSDILERNEIAENYYIAIRNSDNTKMIELIAKNTGFDFQDVEKIINHIFKEKHRFKNGELKFFDSDEYIVMALERIKTKEYTNQDITLLNHELLELTYMKNKKYNVYEVAHAMANKKYNWESLL